ncbi:hypothetical protein [Caldifermentibacillus hisashii]|uniref:hypothetical protein n=1 Tax=Caldifermentibacillus hisashii TaxID=996558 RepID=UPI003101435B
MPHTLAGWRGQPNYACMKKVVFSAKRLRIGDKSISRKKWFYRAKRLRIIDIKTEKGLA